MSNNTLKHVMYHDHHEKCPSCNAIDSLSLYDSKNKEYNYQMILDTHNTNLLKNKSFRYFKCNKCKKVFNIDWTGCVPVPLNNDKINNFIKNCKDLKSKDK